MREVASSETTKQKQNKTGWVERRAADGSTCAETKVKRGKENSEQLD